MLEFPHLVWFEGIAGHELDFRDAAIRFFVDFLNAESELMKLAPATVEPVIEPAEISSLLVLAWNKI